MPIVKAPLTIVSMVMPRDVPMYVLAMKSFYRHLRRGKIVTILDRGTQQVHRDTLQHHFPGIECLSIEDINPGSCQRGGTWERLVFLLDRSRDEYAIQLDADTLAFGTDLHEVGRCIEQNVAFTMADGWSLQSMRTIAEDAKASRSNYVGIYSESMFDEYPNSAKLQYVRGSSGFAGFAKGGFSREQIEEFHSIMEHLCGDRWREWGTEQNGSNFAVANSPGAVILPYPAYSSYSGQEPSSETKFYHFIGSHRFDNGLFAQLGCRVIEQIQCGPPYSDDKTASFVPGQAASTYVASSN